jgi:hypothetical protein
MAGERMGWLMDPRVNLHRVTGLHASSIVHLESLCLALVAGYRGSMRRLAFVCCACLACTRLNPAFDEAEKTSKGGADAAEDTSDDDSSSDSSSDSNDETDTDQTSDTGFDDMPGSACMFEPTAGLAIKLGSPFGGNSCPTSFNAWARIGVGDGGEAKISVCNLPGCDGGCTTDLSMSAFPLLITNHLPSPETCVMIQAGTPLLQEPNACLWGSLSVVSPINSMPFVVAITHSAPLTPQGLEIVGPLIPDPVKAGSCNCDDIGQGNDCCYQAEGPPDFWYFPFEGANVFPGDVLPISIPNQANLDHRFELYQAQRIRSCESQELQLSWALVAKLQGP